MRIRGFVCECFYKFIVALFIVMMSVILIIDLFFVHKLKCVKDFLLPNICLLFLGFVLVLGATFLYIKFIKHYVSKLTKKQCNCLLLIYSVSMFIMQIFVIQKAFFLTGWDAGLLRDTAGQVVQGLKFQSGNSCNWYFNLYPNNVFLLFIFTVILKLSAIIGVAPNLLLAVFGALSVNISIFLLIKIIGTITNNKHMCVLGGAISTVFIMFSPWIIIPYSDTYAMVFTTGVIYIYLKKNNMNQYLSAFLITAMSIIGYKIKPTVIIILIAIIILELLRVLFINKVDLKSIIKFCITIMAAVILCGTVVKMSNTYLEYEKNTDQEFPMTHFMMMGMNPVTRGIYLQDDVDYTASYKGLDNKKNANIKMIKERLKNYKVTGYCKLLMDKSLINYDDGTFAWAEEGTFYLQLNENNGRVATFLKNIYYTDGKYYEIYKTFMQMIWLTILFFTIFSLKNIIDYRQLAIPLTIIGITIFLFLFEARARYLFLYAPFYILLSVAGFYNIMCIRKIKEGTFDLLRRESK